MTLREDIIEQPDLKLHLNGPIGFAKSLTSFRIE